MDDDLPALGLYVLDGRKPVRCRSLEAWAEFMQDPTRRVAETELGPLRISTVFLGLDHGWRGVPELFETMIFGDDNDRYQTRCATWEQAEAMHAEAVAVARGWVAKARFVF